LSAVPIWADTPLDEIIFHADGRGFNAPETIVSDDKGVRNKAHTFQSQFPPPALHIPAVSAVKLFDPSDRSPVNAESLQ
jgi:hypothetical protein